MKKNINKDNAIIIACSMLKDELLYIIKKIQLDLEIDWIEKGLHEFPEKLNQELKSHIDQYSDRKYILLAYGMCGLSVLNLYSSNATMIIPMFDDCVRMLMCKEKGEKIPTKPNHFYFTKAWIDSERFLFTDFNNYIEDYGEEDGMAIIEMMIGAYEAIDFIDNGTYNVMSVCDSMKEEASKYGLSCGCVEGTLRVLEKMLTGNWDDEFVVKQPGEMITLEDFDHRAVCE